MIYIHFNCLTWVEFLIQHHFCWNVHKNSGTIINKKVTHNLVVLLPQAIWHYGQWKYFPTFTTLAQYLFYHLKDSSICSK